MGYHDLRTFIHAKCPGISLNYCGFLSLVALNSDERGCLTNLEEEEEETRREEDEDDTIRYERAV